MHIKSLFHRPYGSAAKEGLLLFLGVQKFKIRFRFTAQQTDSTSNLSQAAVFHTIAETFSLRLPRRILRYAFFR